MLLVGGLIGCPIGYFLDNWHNFHRLKRTTNNKPKEKISDLGLDEAWYAALFEKNPTIILLINAATGRIKEANPSAGQYYGYSIEQLTQMHFAEITALPNEEITGRFPYIKTAGKQTLYSRHRLASGEIREVEVISETIVIDSTSLLFCVVQDITPIKALRGMIPICSHCKQIRDITGGWTQLEAYIQAHSEAYFSHGLCPNCARQHYPTLYELHKK